MRCSRKVSARLIPLALFSIHCLSVGVYGQRVVEPAGAKVVRTISWRDVSVHGEVRISLGLPPNSKLDEDLLRITLQSLPSGTSLGPKQISGVRLIDGPDTQLIIKLRSHAPADAMDSDLRITIHLPQRSPSLEDLSILQQIIDAAPAIIIEGIAYEKTTKEKHLLVSPSLSFPAGGGGDFTANGVLYQGNILRLGTLINQIDFGFDLEKGSENQADPNYLNLGVNFRKIIPLHRKKIGEGLRSYRRAYSHFQALTRGSAANALTREQVTESQRSLYSALEDVAELKKTFFRDIIITPLSPRLELNFSGFRPGPVTNFINNSDLQLRTGSKTFLSRHLFWSLKLNPIGFESGVTLRNRDDRGRRGQTIFRLNAGAEAKLKFRFPCRDDLLADRIELEVKGMNRHLFNEESAFNSLTKRNDLQVKGSKYSAQVNLRYVFGFNVPFPTRVFGLKLPDLTRRPALTLSYKNGYFPPVYGFNNSFGFRFTLASGDEDNSSDLRLTKSDLLEP